MLVLKRKDGQWVEVRHRSGDMMRIRVSKIRPGARPHLDLAFEDDARNFDIQRPERAEALVRPGSGTGSGTPAAADPPSP